MGRGIRGDFKNIIALANTEEHKYNFTHIHKYKQAHTNTKFTKGNYTTKWTEGSGDSKNFIVFANTEVHKYTNIQIQTNTHIYTQITNHRGIPLKGRPVGQEIRGDFKNIIAKDCCPIPIYHKYIINIFQLLGQKNSGQNCP